MRVTREVQRRWRTFSRTGSPGDDWPAYSDIDRAVMVFDRKSHLEFDPHPERRRAWEGFSLAR
jgi:para-nitrobenzyl esterase